MAEPSTSAQDGPRAPAASCEGSPAASPAGSRHAPGAIRGDPGPAAATWFLPAYPPLACEYCGVVGCLGACGRDVARPCGEWC